MAYECKCDCHKIPGCKMCNECYLGHGVTLRQWKNGRKPLEEVYGKKSSTHGYSDLGGYEKY